MKKLLIHMLALAVVFSGAITLSAQESNSSIIVVQKIKQEDGTVTTVKKRISDRKEALQYLRSIDDEEGKEVDIQVFSPENGHVTLRDGKLEADGETVLFIRRAKIGDTDGQEQEEKFERLQIVLSDDEPLHREQIRPNRPLLGIYPGHSNESEGIFVRDIVAGGGAAVAGIRAGDVITAINGEAINNQRDLREVLSKYQAGDLVHVSYQRDGEAAAVGTTLTERRDRNEEAERDPCQVFIGVYLNSSWHDGSEGVRVTGVIEETPAEVAGLQRGDVITAIDGIAVHTFNEVLHERNKHEPGDWFTLSYQRGDSRVDVETQFRSCEEAEAIDKEVLTEEIPPEKTEEAAPETPMSPLDRTLQLTDFSTFPNPTFGRLNLRFEGEAVPTTIQVTGPDGRIIYEETLNRFDGFYDDQLNIRKETPGTYFLNIRQGDKVLTEKVVLMPRA
jgi:membrane-associated protease RseP (regulator of RpoE activity)